MPPKTAMQTLAEGAAIRRNCGATLTCIKDKRHPTTCEPARFAW